MKGSVGPEGVIDVLPAAEFLVETGGVFGFHFKEMVELIVVGFVGAFDEGVFFGRVGVGEEVGNAELLGGLIEVQEKLAAVIGLEVSDREGEGEQDLFEEALGGFRRGGGRGPEDAQAGAGVNGGELIDLRAVTETQVLGVHLDQGAGESLFEVPGRALAFAPQAAEALLSRFGEEETVLFEKASEGGGRKPYAMPGFEQDGKLVLAPGGELPAQGEDGVHRALRQRGGPDAAGASGAVFEGT
jgi:hypothetical protein